MGRGAWPPPPTSSVGGRVVPAAIESSPTTVPAASSTPTATDTPVATATPVPSDTPVPSAAPAPDPVLIAAGDIASCVSDGDEATAKLVEAISGTVVTLGDNVYENGTAEQFAGCYDPTWGQFKDRTRPS